MFKKSSAYLICWVISFGMTFEYVYRGYDLKWVVLMGVSSLSMLLVVLYNDLAEYLQEGVKVSNEK